MRVSFSATAAEPTAWTEDLHSGIRRVPRCYDSLPEEGACTVPSEVVTSLARLSLGSSIPELGFAGDLTGLPLDPSAAFVLSLVDGKSSVSEIADASPAGEEGTLAMLAQLVVMGLVTVP